MSAISKLSSDVYVARRLAIARSSYQPIDLDHTLMDADAWAPIVHKRNSGAPDITEGPNLIGGPSRTRTLAPLIQSCAKLGTRDAQRDQNLTNQRDPEELDILLDRPCTGCFGSAAW